MRIPNIENSNQSMSQLLLDPKVIAIIEKLANQPLLLEKITIEQNPVIQLKIANNSAVQQINVPLSISNELSSLAISNDKLTLHISNNQIVLSLIPKASQTLLDILDNEKNSAFYFKKGQLVENSTLILSQNIKKSLPLINETQILQTLQSNKLNKDIHSNLNFNSNNEISIKEAISHFLKAKPLEQPSLSSSISKIISNQNNLLLSIQNPKLFIDKIVSSITSNIAQKNDTVNPIFIKDFLFNNIELLPESNNITKLNQLINKIDELTKNIDFSVNNKQLKLQQRVNSNGIFLESKLEKFDSQKTENIQNQTSFNQSILKTNKSDNVRENINKANPETNLSKMAHEIKQLPDLKLTVLSIKDSLQTLLADINSNEQKPIYYGRVIQSILNNPVLLKSLLNYSTNLESQSQTQLLTNLTKALSQILANPNLANSTALENLDKLQPSLNQFFDTIKSLLALPKEKDSNAPHQFTNPVNLRELLSDGRLLNFSKNILFNQKFEDALLNHQRQLIQEMIKDSSVMINKIETNQLLSLKNESSTIQQYLLDLPILHKQQIESFELLLESKANNTEGSSSKTWTITVKFDLEPLGPMFARVSLKNERISTHFFAKNQDTANLLVENIDHLKESFLFAGLEIEEISGQQGVVPNELIVNDEVTIDVHA